MLSESEGYDLLKSYGIPTPGFRVATSPDDAAEAAFEIGFPVVMKIVSPDIIHKSDAGAVFTNISSREEAKTAFSAIINNSLSHLPGARIEGVIVEEQAKPGLELIIGGKNDPTFGKTVIFGMGGTLVELNRDVTLRILPLEEREYGEMIHDINGYPLIAGYRGKSPKDEEGLVRILKSACRMFLEEENIQEFDINPVRLYEHGAVAVDSRIVICDPDPDIEPYGPKSLDTTVFSPSSVAVIGATDNPVKMGYVVMRNMQGFSGRIYPVNIRSESVFGMPAYPSVSAIDGVVDMAVVVVPATAVPGIIDECGKKGVRIAVIISSGFGETGSSGADLDERIRKIANGYGMRIVGPNCLGLITPENGLNTTVSSGTPVVGGIALLSQSGAILNTMVDWAVSKGVGFSAVVSVGNQSDLSFIDYLEWLKDDPGTEAIIMYIEEIRHGREFMDLVSEITKTKPVVAVKSGYSKKGRVAASSHTVSLSGSYEVYMEAFRRSGIISVNTLKIAYLVSEFLSQPKHHPKGSRAIVISNAGGFSVLASDEAERFGVGLIDLPEGLLSKLDGILPYYWNRNNPIDLLGDATEERLAEVFDLLVDYQESWDIAFVLGFPNLIIDSGQLARQVVRFLDKTEKHVVSIMLGGDFMDEGREFLNENGIMSFEELETAFVVMGRILQHFYRVKAPGLI